MSGLSAGLPRPGTLPAPLAGLPVAQIGILVPDLAAGIATWSALLGADDWLVYTYGPETVPRLTYRGEPGTFRMRVALTGDAPQVELIESLAGPSIYTEWIAEHGYGLHHLGFRVPSAETAVREMRASGVGLLQSGGGYGQDGDGGFAYFDTQDSVGLLVEAIEVPERRRPSEAPPRGRG
ncbi:VOC family protein [Streptomyces sp. NBC_01498]|uniref:VOC family protein n=1 Tax=Streptomyces sp. NBC_01498 TaxID=2975870 RepID=UPI002E7BAEA1|nr:VOC family protein [Streptomyces sp. NBC_01498]WTL25342.1 VOC family protein [Streptomyces sp. NBC_01498]